MSLTEDLIRPLICFIHSPTMYFDRISFQRIFYFSLKNVWNSRDYAMKGYERILNLSPSIINTILVKIVRRQRLSSKNINPTYVKEIMVNRKLKEIFSSVNFNIKASSAK